MKPIIYCEWNVESNFEYNKEIEIYIDQFPKNCLFENKIRIIIIQESFNTQWLRDIVMNPLFDNYYSYVFTYNQQILDTHNRAVHFLGICTWIRNYDFKPKKFSVSTLVGGKIGNNLEGYDLRHKLWFRQNEISIPKDFYLSSARKFISADYNNNLILYNEKEPMFDNYFHITIENTRLQNVFTEKLIDCFQTKTIPIYYGCPNLSNYFNMEGIIIVNNVDDIISVCNNLIPEIYNEKLLAIEDNYNRSMNYISYQQLLDNKLSELFNK